MPSLCRSAIFNLSANPIMFLKNQLKSRPCVFTCTYTTLFPINRGQSDGGNSYNSDPEPQHKDQNTPFNRKAKACHSLPFSFRDGSLIQSACLAVTLKLVLPSPITSMNSNYLMFLLCHFSQTTLPLWESVDRQRPLSPQGLSARLSYRKWQPPTPTLALPLPFSVTYCSIEHSTITTTHLAIYLSATLCPQLNVSSMKALCLGLY